MMCVCFFFLPPPRCSDASSLERAEAVTDGPSDAARKEKQVRLASRAAESRRGEVGDLAFNNGWMKGGGGREEK